MRVLLVLAFCATACAYARVGCVGAPTLRAARAERTTGVVASLDASEPALMVLNTLPTDLLADSSPLDFLAAFANSPFILLVPIGAGALVAGIIIFILVKSAG